MSTDHLLLDRPPSATRGRGDDAVVPPVPTHHGRARRPRTYRWLVVRLAALYAATVPLLNVVLLPGIGTLSRAFGGAFALVGLGALVARGRQRHWHDAHVTALVLLGWVVLSQAWTTTPAATGQTVQTAAQLVISFLLVWEYCPGLDELRSLLRGFVLGAAGAAIAVMVTALSSTGLAERYAVGEAHPNDLGFVIALAVPCAWYLADHARGPVAAAAYRSYAFLAVLAITFTASRSSLLMVGVALLVVPGSFRRMTARARLAMVGMVAAAVVVALPFVPDRPVERLGTIAEEADGGDFSGRTDLWAQSLDVVAENPLTGVGAGGSRTALLAEGGAAKGVHNTYLSVAVELGLVGFVLWMVLMGACLLPALRVRGPERLFLRVVSTVLVLGLVPRHWEYGKSTWLFLAVILGMAMAARALAARGAEVRG